MAVHLSVIAALALQVLAADVGQGEVKIGAPVPPMLLTKAAVQARQEPSTTHSYTSVALQIPIATVCSNSNAASNVFTPVSFNNAPSSTTSATAVLADGGSTTFAILAPKENVEKQVSSASYSDMPQLVLGTDGCQTLFTPTKTAICSTLVTPAGLPPITITNCAQYITFSSETVHQCPPIPTITPLPADLETFSAILPDPATALQDPRSIPKRQIAIDRNGRPIMTDLGTVAPTLSRAFPSSTLLNSSNLFSKIFPIPALHAKQRRSHILAARQAASNYTLYNTTLSLNNTSLNLTQTLPLANLQNIRLSPPAPTKYYAAPWQEVLAGVPSTVKGITCYGGLPPIGECTTPDMDGDTEPCECSTADESWSPTTYQQVRTGTTVASFSGNAIVTSGDFTTTTLINFANTLTTTRTENYTSIVKSTLTGEPTVRITQTSIPSATISMLTISPQGNVFAAMPQEQAASVASKSTNIPSADAMTTPEAQPSTTSMEPLTSMTMPPYLEPTDLTSSTTTIPGMSTMQFVKIASDAGISLPAFMATDPSLSISRPTGDLGMDEGEAITTRVTSITTETVTVTPAGGIETGPMIEKRESWPTEVWAANLPMMTSKPVVAVGDDGEELPARRPVVSNV